LFSHSVVVGSLSLLLIVCIYGEIQAKSFSYLDKNAGLSFNFAAVGDWGCRNNTRNTLNNIVSNDPEIVLGLGDYSYETSADCWLDIIDPIKEKMKIAIGNHESEIRDNTYGNGSYHLPSLLNEYMSNFGLKEQFYSFEYQNVHFTVMSTEISAGPDSEQYAFVKNDLANASASARIDWLVVYFHVPMYTTSDLEGNRSALRNYHPLFDKYGVDLVLQASRHSYERTYPLVYNPSNLSAPLVTNKETNYYHDPRGQIFAVVGTGGRNLHPITNRSLNSFNVIELSEYGFLNVEIANEDGLMTMNAIFYTNDGRIGDRFVINKSHPI
jgi:Calcineurin-like phosphoesterase